MTGELWKRRQHRLIDGARAGRAAHYHEHRLLTVQPEKLAPLFAITGENFGAYGRTGVNTLAVRVFDRLRKGAAFHFGEGTAELVGQTGRHIRFMNDDGYAVQLRAEYHGYGYEPAFGKAHVGLELANDGGRLSYAFDYAEGIGKIFRIEVSSKLAHGYRMEGDVWNA